LHFNLPPEHPAEQKQSTTRRNA